MRKYSVDEKEGEGVVIVLYVKRERERRLKVDEKKKRKMMDERITRSTFYRVMELRR